MNLSQCYFPTTIPVWTDPGANRFRGESPATNRLGYETAKFYNISAGHQLPGLLDSGGTLPCSQKPEARLYPKPVYSRPVESIGSYPVFLK
jgi:hypothetical protein